MQNVIEVFDDFLKDKKLITQGYINVNCLTANRFFLERKVVEFCHHMAIESLPPDDYQSFVDILNQLIDTRHLKIDKFSREVLPYAKKKSKVTELRNENIKKK